MTLPRPLITAADMYPALEHIALSARDELLMSFRVFDAETPLRSKAALDLGCKTWADLIAHRVADGVKVFILLTDFDPLFATDLHRDTWASARGFASAAPGAAIRAAMHGAKLGPVWQRLFSSKIREKLARLAEKPEIADDTPLLTARAQGHVAVHPVTLHQKFAVADGSHAILGGLDVDERRWDEPDHDQPAEETWHDVSLEVQGPIARDIRAHFLDCWADAATDGAAPFGAEADPAPEPPLPPQSGPLRLLRTISRPRPGPMAFAPRNTVAEIEAVHRDAFRNAQKLVYLETQFFRHRPLARALSLAAAENPDLEVILVLPAEPERVHFHGHSGLDARHEQALQLHSLEMIRSAFGRRLAVVSPAKPEPINGDEGKGLAGAGIVYVHAKVTVVDDALAIVGSANLNGRSMRWDTEAALSVADAGFATTLRQRLAVHWLGPDRATNAHRAATWAQAAQDNLSRRPEDREGFVMPFPWGRTRRFSALAPFLPAEMF